ncbi:MAG: hypothetical protein AABX91_02520 [Nanoarchaeota archaeon]
MTKGLARLAELEHARILEQSARFSIARANQYSTEHDWVNETYARAQRDLRKAEEIRRADISDSNSSPYDLS